MSSRELRNHQVRGERDTCGHELECNRGIAGNAGAHKEYSGKREYREWGLLGGYRGDMRCTGLHI